MRKKAPRDLASAARNSIYTEKTIFPFPFKLNGIWSWWQFSFRFWTKWISIWFKIERKTVTTIVSHSIWKEIEYEFSQCTLWKIDFCFFLYCAEYDYVTISLFYFELIWTRLIISKNINMILLTMFLMFLSQLAYGWFRNKKKIVDIIWNTFNLIRNKNPFLCGHPEISIFNLVNSNKIWIGITIFRLIWNQAEFRLVVLPKHFH